MPLRLWNTKGAATVVLAMTLAATGAAAAAEIILAESIGAPKAGAAK
jgi:hypothetical protein